MSILQLLVLGLLGTFVSSTDVVVLDKDNFDGIALDTSKDVLVEFYAPCEYAHIAYRLGLI